ncbi:MAG: ATP-binding domain-containing protein, partial [Flavobacteriaceae bacterium]|nr:ATP-binding domain-containing protein [Flavobacteriaceae bacterium]
KNKNRLDKVVWTANDDGNKIKVHRSITDAEEGRYVANTIFDMQMQNQMHNGEFAVLYRTNSQSRAIEDALRKKDIPYRIYGGLSFYQRKEIKDVLAYLRLVLNPKDEEALKRIINFPARGIGQTTVEKLVVAANHYNRSIFEVMEHIDKVNLNINAGIKTKLRNFVTMIKSFQVSNQASDAFQLAELVSKKSGLMLQYKKDGTPEGIAKLENIEELLNGMQDFVEGQKELDGATGSLAEFMEDVALATDLDQDDGEDDRVALMTIHLAKGLEFPYVFIVGMEEDLFPSAMSMNTRSELEEERRLFYVALTRAEKQAYLTYTQSRYRWGKLIDAEPSRFIEEIDQIFIEYLNPPLDSNYRYKPMIDVDIFGEVDKSKLRQNKPKSGTPPTSFKPNQEQLRKLRKIKPELSSSDGPKNIADLHEGLLVRHTRFGRGRVLKLEGRGNDKKAEIQFENGQIKKLLLRFAKLDIIS